VTSTSPELITRFTVPVADDEDTAAVSVTNCSRIDGLMSELRVVVVLVDTGLIVSGTPAFAVRVADVPVMAGE
jgi:hypothetical protein